MSEDNSIEEENKQMMQQMMQMMQQMQERQREFNEKFEQLQKQSNERQKESNERFEQLQKEINQVQSDQHGLYLSLNNTNINNNNSNNNNLNNNSLNQFPNSGEISFPGTIITGMLNDNNNEEEQQKQDEIVKQTSVIIHTGDVIPLNDENLHNMYRNYQKDDNVYIRLENESRFKVNPQLPRSDTSSPAIGNGTIRFIQFVLDQTVLDDNSKQPEPLQKPKKPPDKSIPHVTPTLQSKSTAPLLKPNQDIINHVSKLDLTLFHIKPKKSEAKAYYSELKAQYAREKEDNEKIVETSKSQDNIIQGFKPEEIDSVTLEVHQDNQKNESTRVARPLQHMISNEKQVRFAE